MKQVWVDNGVGMTAEQLHDYMQQLFSGEPEGTGNFQMGAPAFEEGGQS